MWARAHLLHGCSSTLLPQSCGVIARAAQVGWGRALGTRPVKFIHREGQRLGPAATQSHWGNHTVPGHATIQKLVILVECLRVRAHLSMPSTMCFGSSPVLHSLASVMMVVLWHQQDQEEHILGSSRVA